ncbi:MAG: transcriptional activator NhaR [Sedimenticola sp.]|nr:MAG: transcriptional activator NhaR [Sedimenticola sp.]
MLNYKHLHYFWVVAKEGGVVRASERLNITPQTISGQLSLLEEQLGETLFDRTGRNMTLNETGRLVLSYADEIFSLGGELVEMVHNLPKGRPPVFRVGVTDVVPKSIAYRLLAPALQLPGTVKIICREGSVKSLLADLAVHQIDLIIADSPIPAGVSVRGFNHLLGDCGLSFMASPELMRTLDGDFPQCLKGQPLMLPGERTEIRGKLLDWFDGQNIHPHIIGEFDDSALMKAFGRAGVGIFVVPTPIEKEVTEQFGVESIGQTDEVRDYFYAISVERKISHPAVAAVTEAARDWLISEEPAHRSKKPGKTRR